MYLSEKLERAIIFYDLNHLLPTNYLAREDMINELIKDVNYPHFNGLLDYFKHGAQDKKLIVIPNEYVSTFNRLIVP